MTWAIRERRVDGVANLDALGVPAACGRAELSVPVTDEALPELLSDSLSTNSKALPSGPRTEICSPWNSKARLRSSSSSLDGRDCWLMQIASQSIKGAVRTLERDVPDRTGGKQATNPKAEDRSKEKSSEESKAEGSK